MSVSKIYTKTECSVPTSRTTDTFFVVDAIMLRVLRTCPMSEFQQPTFCLRFGTKLLVSSMFQIGHAHSACKVRFVEHVSYHFSSPLPRDI